MACMTEKEKIASIYQSLTAENRRKVDVAANLLLEMQEGKADAALSSMIRNSKDPIRALDTAVGIVMRSCGEVKKHG